MHRPLLALDVSPKVSSALRCCPKEHYRAHKKQISPVPKVSDNVQRFQQLGSSKTIVGR